MRIALASDHAGFPLKDELVRWLSGKEEITVIDLGTHSTDSVDYPYFAGRLCMHLLEGSSDRGILICNSGIGMSMSANRFRGIRAALCLFPDMAYWARHHNDANVLVLGGGNTAPFLAKEMVRVFLDEPFDGGRHAGRVAGVDELGGA